MDNLLDALDMHESNLQAYRNGRYGRYGAYYPELFDELIKSENNIVHEINIKIQTFKQNVREEQNNVGDNLMHL